MKITYDMVLEYPKVFDFTKYLNEDGEDIGYTAYTQGNYEGEIKVDTSEHNKPGGVDRGNAQSQHKFLRDLAKNPVATVNAYFTSQEDLDSLLAVEGFEDEVTNPQTGAKSTRIKEGNPDYGIGKYIQLKRPINNIVEFVDRKTGDVKEVDKGGYPSVKILKDGAFVPYDYDELGPITNGTESKVRFEVYGKGNTRLEAFGITNLVEWVEYEGDTQDEF